MSFSLGLKTREIRGGMGQGPSLGSGQLMKILLHKQTKKNSKSLGQNIKAWFRSEPLLLPGLSLNDPVSVQASNILARSTSK